MLHLLDFLAAFDASKNPPVRDIADYKLYLLRSSALPAVPGVRLTPSGEAWLAVDFVELPTRPDVPDALVALIGPTHLLDPQRPPAIPDLDALESSLEGEEPPDVEVVEAATAWIEDVWTDWSLRHRDAVAAKRLYRDLFEQRERLAADRDALELVWGFRRLRWAPGAGRVIDHPLLSIPVEVDLQAETSMLLVRPAGALEVEALYLADTAIDDRVGLNAARQAIAEVDSATDPWDAPSAAELARRIVRSIDQDGGLLGDGDFAPTAAVADESWVLYLRRRRPDYQGFLDGMRELYRSGAVLPDTLASLVVNSPSTLVGSVHEERGSSEGVGASEPLLLPKETNEEQQRILRLAQRRPGVTVQGPPGTGKSHTIANIISHYVAYGKRVLVVAEKEQALSVLAAKIPEGIRDLTVSVLGADEEGRRRLESSISTIQTRVAAIDPAHEDREIERLTDELDALDRTIASTVSRLRRAVFSETEAINGTWAAGAAPTPSDAARWVAEHPELNYIDDPIPLGVRPPLSPADLADYVRLLENPTLDWAAKALQQSPASGQLPEGAALHAQLTKLDELRAALSPALAYVASWDTIDATNTELLRSVAVAVSDEADFMAKSAGSWVEAIRHELSDPLLRAEWATFAQEMSEHRERLVTMARQLEARNISVPAGAPPSLTKQLTEARDRLAGKGKLGLFAGDAKKAIEQCRVDGRPPATAAELDLCLLGLERLDRRTQMVNRWTNRIERVSGPPIDGLNPEDAVGRHLGQIEKVLTAPERWAQLRAGLTALGITSPVSPTLDELQQLEAAMEACSERASERQVAAWLADLDRRLADGESLENASPMWAELRRALGERDLERWDQWRQVAAYLETIEPFATRLFTYRTKLLAVTPNWVAHIDRDRAAAGDPSLFIKAWEWRQLETHLRDVEQTGSPAALQAYLEQLGVRRRRLVAELVTTRAWRRLADNIGDRERQALNSYLQATKRFGKTGGKFAARWLAQIRAALNDSKSAVPVWIMTTNRALASFRPDRTPPFDVIVVDEASQIGLEALPLLSLAKAAIVVGDDKQTSPENVGLERQSYFDLLDEHLALVPTYRTLFDADNSLYDVAFQKFPDVVMLTEHFRCLPPIISFSNTHCYDGRIIPLRDQPPRPGWIALGAIKVDHGYRTGDLNRPEAEAVVDLIERLCLDPSYDGMDFGVVSLLGSTQSVHIRNLLVDRLGPAVVEARRIRCGEAANFQGDERNVMVVSTVVATDPSRPSGRVAAMTNRAAERRINVAASRARDQLWVVHSVDADQFAEGDLRGSLIRHCRNPAQIETQLDDFAERCDSDFEVQVKRAGFGGGWVIPPAGAGGCGCDGSRSARIRLGGCRRWRCGVGGG
ncbi:MAG: AAA domain-containing protein [Vicinamibacterales bacterium]